MTMYKTAKHSRLSRVYISMVFMFEVHDFAMNTLNKLRTICLITNDLLEFDRKPGNIFVGIYRLFRLHERLCVRKFAYKYTPSLMPNKYNSQLSNNEKGV